MVYRAIGLMSGSSLDGLDIAFAEFHEEGGKWSYEIVQADCLSYSADWVVKLKDAIHLSARDYQLLHAEYGHYTGQLVSKFISKHQLDYKVSLIASHGHTTFHIPGSKMTAQLGDGAAIAAVTGLPVVSDLRAMDVALSGQGAPIVPIGEKLLLTDYDYFLNIGGIANISMIHGKTPETKEYIAFDICPANRVLNMLANEVGKDFDENGILAAIGAVDHDLLDKLNKLEYYQKKFPKSLANDFGTDTVYPLLKDSAIEIKDLLRTYTDHIVFQTGMAIAESSSAAGELLVTGGGALNSFLIQCLAEQLAKQGIKVVVPDRSLVNFKEALIMAFIGVLRWRQEFNVLSSVTGATRDSVGGALWAGA